MGRQTPGTAAMMWDRGFYYFQEPETRKYILKQGPTFKCSKSVFPNRPSGELSNIYFNLQELFSCWKDIKIEIRAITSDVSARFAVQMENKSVY